LAQPESAEATATATKRCPFCAAEIRATASKCGHCGSILKVAPAAATQKRDRFRKAFIWIVGIALGAWLIRSVYSTLDAAGLPQPGAVVAEMEAAVTTTASRASECGEPQTQETVNELLKTALVDTLATFLEFDETRRALLAEGTTTALSEIRLTGVDAVTGQLSCTATVAVRLHNNDRSSLVTHQDLLAYTISAGRGGRYIELPEGKNDALRIARELARTVQNQN
jgi:hypothetical protein